MGEPDGPMNIVVMDKSWGGAAKPAECKQPTHAPGAGSAGWRARCASPCQCCVKALVDSRTHLWL